MSTIVPAIIKNDFEIGPRLYIPAVSFILLGLILGTIADFQINDFYSMIVDPITIGIIAFSIVLRIAKRIGNNTALAIALYAGAANFMLEVLQAIFDNRPDFAGQIMYLFFASSVFMAVGGFIVTKKASLVFGAFILALLGIAAFVRQDPLLAAELPVIVPTIIGFAFVLYYYRGSLEKLFLNLHEINDRISLQRDEMKKLKEEAEHALTELQRAQTRIVAQEKLASLGSLTAGIAHEIKNPLNFITNFSESSIELMNELSIHYEKISTHLGESDREDVDYLLGELRQNMLDIKEHGRRGDHIVKSMLMHSRSGTSTFTREDVNALAEECLNLAYHGLRAQDSSFQAHRDFAGAPDVGDIDMVRGDLSRVLLNLCNNAFYSVNKKKQKAGPDFRGVVRVAITPEADHILIQIRDNGIGIPPDVKEKLFLPFFTTKPTGEGTGLGLSMSHDIIVQVHGGSIEVDSVVGEWASFTIRIPKHAKLSAAPATTLLSASAENPKGVAS